jgi:hypothetical protein
VGQPALCAERPALHHKDKTIVYASGTGTKRTRTQFAPCLLLAGSFVLAPTPGQADPDFLTRAITACTTLDTNALGPLTGALTASGWQLVTDENRDQHRELAIQASLFYDMQKGMTVQDLEQNLETMRADHTDRAIPDDPSKPHQSYYHPGTPDSLLLAYPWMGLLHCEFVISRKVFNGPWMTQFLTMAAEENTPEIKRYTLQEEGYIGYETYSYTPYGTSVTIVAPDGEANIYVDIPDIETILKTVPEFNVRALIEIRFNPGHQA